MSDERVAITGFGCVTPLGNDAASTWAALVEGRSGVDYIERFDASGFPTTFAAEVRDFVAPVASNKYTRWGDAKAAFATAAANEALRHAHLERGDVDPNRFGVSVGAEVSRPELALIAQRIGDLKSLAPDEVYRSVHPKDFLVMSAWFPSSVLATLYDAAGPNLTTSTACTSSAQAVGDAMRILRRGDADVMLAGGTDRLVEELMLVGFGLLGALSTRTDDPQGASRPFDRTRDGFVLGEGAGFVVLERLEHARRRGAPIQAELLGYGCSANAWRITDSPSDGRGARQAMQAAIRDAGITPADVHYVNAHGTSTQQNDTSESAAVHGAFGAFADRVPVSSSKSMMGHLVAACGAVELIVCVRAIQEGIVPPTINYRHPDKTCDLDYVPNEARRAEVRVALTNAFGFGGSNGSLVVGRYDGRS